MASTTSNELLRTEPAVMASEVERLPDLTGFLKLASVPDWYSVRLTPSSVEARPRPRRPLTTPPVPPQAPTQRPDDAVDSNARGPRSAPPAGGPKGSPRKRQTPPVDGQSKNKRVRKARTASAAPAAGIENERPSSAEGVGSMESRGSVRKAPGGSELRD